MSKFLCLSILLLFSTNIQAEDGDCSFDQLADPGLHVYYYGLRNLTFTTDDEIYLRRCHDQLDSADFLMCFANRCLKGRALELYRKILRAAQYEVLHLCHPHANPEQQKAFKDLTDCHNKIWPNLHECVVDYAWKMAAVPQASGNDISRYCCAMHEVDDCIIAASKECPPAERPHFEEIADLYQGDAMQMMCTGNPHHENPSTCSELPPVEKNGEYPPPIFGTFVLIANKL